MECTNKKWLRELLKPYDRWRYLLWRASRVKRYIVVSLQDGKKLVILRLLDAGYKVIYAPNLRVVHYVDLRGRDWKKIRRLWARNAMLTTFLRYPWWAVFSAIVCTLTIFVRMKDESGQRDWAGIVWTVSSFTNLIPFALANRRPIKSQTLKLFKELRRQPVPVLSQ